MTREEAKAILYQKIKPCVLGEWGEAIDMAIEALSANTVSREFYEEAIKANHGLAQELCELKASADRQTIVRCGECKWYKDFDGCFFSTAECEPEHFCSWGKRKDDTMR